MYHVQKSSSLGWHDNLYIWTFKYFFEKKSARNSRGRRKSHFHIYIIIIIIIIIITIIMVKAANYQLSVFSKEDYRISQTVFLKPF